MDVLILGANGFIGSHLTARILADTDWNVFALDLGSDRLAQWIDSPRVRARQRFRTNSAQVEAWTLEVPPSRICARTFSFDGTSK